MALLDISRSVSPSTAVWPGDQPVKWSWTARLDDPDATVNLGAICMSAHAGTHADAPYHVSENGRTTEGLPLSAFVGPVEIRDVQSASAIRPEHVEDVETRRVLFKTPASALADNEWPDSITAIDPDTVHRFDEEGGVLIGTDAPSVDPLDSTALPAHHALRETGIVNLEGLSLQHVTAGRYHLMALPLKLAGADAAPVRAILSDSEPG